MAIGHYVLGAWAMLAAYPGPALAANLPGNGDAALAFERSNWAIGSVSSDPFYDLPDNFTTALEPGVLLKLEAVTDTSRFSLPPNVALSRFLFTSQTYNGTTVPASAYILWPFSPNLQPGTDKAQVVAFSHGNAGVFGDCGPSHLRTLQYFFQAPYTLALSGYAVVAPDYQGLGLNYTRDSTGSIVPIRHPLLCGPCLAGDLIHAVEAAQAAFPTRLSDEFVIMGHSQGGGVAWGAAALQAAMPIPGLLGTIAASPVTNMTATVDLVLGLGITEISGALEQAWGMLDIFPDFQLSDVLSTSGITLLEQMAEAGGCNSVVAEVLTGATGLFQDAWYNNYYMRRYWEISTVGGATTGPMLVIQGTADPSVPEPITTGAVDATCPMMANSSLEYLLVNGTTHVPTLYATQKQWLAWIKNRFDGRPLSSGCSTATLNPFLPIDQYQPETTWFMEHATDSYQLA